MCTNGGQLLGQTSTARLGEKGIKVLRWRWSHWEQAVTVSIYKLHATAESVATGTRSRAFYSCNLNSRGAPPFSRYKSVDRISFLFLWLITWFTYCSDAKHWISDYWQLLKTSGAKTSKPLVPCLFAVVQTDSVRVHIHTCMAALSSNKCNLIKNATWQSKQKSQCGVGSRALVCKPQGPILPRVSRVTPGKSPKCSALLVSPVIKSPAPQSRGCLCTALNNEVLILFEVPWHCINPIILIILYDLLPYHQDSF